MPANLPPEYYKLKHQLEAAKTDEERLTLLEEMRRITPKHKGTEKVRADLGGRIAKLKKGLSQSQSKKGGHSHHIPPQGAGQIALIGLPNVGKSQILASFTKAKPTVSPVPFSTQEPTVGMLDYENIQFQLVDTPSMMTDFVHHWVLDLVRHADLVWLVVSLGSDELLDQVEVVKAKLAEANIDIVSQETPDEDDDPHAKKTVWIIANQIDAPGANARLEILKEFYAEAFRIFPLSAMSGEGLDKLQQQTYRQLNILRVYTKAPGQKVDYDDPIVLSVGSTVIEVAEALHKHFAEGFKFARIWGDDWYDGQTVGRDDVVHEGDVLEFHT